MSVKSRRSLAAVLTAGLLSTAQPAHAQADAPSRDRFTVNVTETPEPDSRAWEDPARIAFTIDPDGDDELSAQINLEVGWDVGGAASNTFLSRSQSVSTYFRWNRETGGDRQNNLETGLVFKRDYDVARLLSRPELSRFTREQRADLAERAGDSSWDTAWRVSAGYARTASYPDLVSATCVATPAVPQCQTQYKESFRASAAATIFHVDMEDQIVRGTGSAERVVFAYSIQPKFGIDYDHLFNSPINVDTGVAASGGYLSVLGGVAVSLTPQFLNPGWELKASAQIRQSLHTSSSRRPSIERTAEQFEVSATYYLLRPAASEQNGWRAGIGIVYTHGGDPLTGAPNVDRIVLALRLGRY